jgi:hypothetical protein
VFSVEDRDRLTSALVAAARLDGRVNAAALLGSTAAGDQDRWSDVDLALSVAADADEKAVIAEWTERMYDQHGAVHHLDVASGGGLYRAFLLANGLQVDLSFWAEAQFRATSPRFRLVFGEPGGTPRAAADPAIDELIGEGWLYALHAQRCIARGRPWQAEHMIGGARDRVLALACVRHGLPARYGRGFDDLPATVTVALVSALVASLQREELNRALRATVAALVVETEQADPELAGRLANPLGEIAGAQRARG